MMDKKEKKKQKDNKDRPKDRPEKDSAEISTTEKELVEKIEELTKEKEQLFQQLQRVSADYANYQRRAPKQIEDSVEYQKKAFIRALLPSLDNFEHAINASHKTESVGEVVKGVEMIFSHMLDALKSQGVKQMQTVGEQFDPNLHEAMMRKSDPGQPDNTVLEEFQKGYMFNEQVLRPAKVIVNKIETEQPQDQSVHIEIEDADEETSGQENNSEQNDKHNDSEE